MAATRLGPGLAALGEPAQLDYGEPIVYAQAARIPNGQALYQKFDGPPYTVAAYTPLYYKLASLLQAKLEPGFGPGRALSFAAGVAAALGIAWLTARQARSMWAGGFAALLFLGLGFPGTVPWFALYRVDMLGVALSVLAVVVLAHGVTVKHALAAGLLCSLAILTKQTFIAAALTGGVWLWSIGQRRSTVLFLVAVVLPVLTVCFVMERSTGAFVANAVVGNANPINLRQVGPFLTLLAQTLGVPLVVAAAYVVVGKAWESARLLTLYWLASFLPLVGLLKFGASYNYWIELAASTAVLATLGLWNVGHWALGKRGVVTWIVLADILVLTTISVSTATAVFNNGGGLTGVSATTRTDFQRLVDVVRAQPGRVLADPLDEVVLAGRPVVLEPVIFALLENHGGWDPEPMVRSICTGEVSLLVLGAPIETVAADAPNGESWWPPRVMRALRDRMQPGGELAGRFLYAPSPGNYSTECGH